LAAMTVKSMNIEQGDIWMVRFYPQKGSEISKLRPAIVVSHNAIGRLPLKTVVPITDWKNSYGEYPWMQKIDPKPANGLSKISAADCFQVKNFSDERFIKKIGEIDAKTLFEIHTTIAKTLNPTYSLTTF